VEVVAAVSLQPVIEYLEVTDEVRPVGGTEELQDVCGAVRQGTVDLAPE
jgi:hypothetical protein